MRILGIMASGGLGCIFIGWIVVCVNRIVLEWHIHHSLELLWIGVTTTFLCSILTVVLWVLCIALWRREPPWA